MVDSSAVGLRNKLFPHYNELTLVFGKYRAIEQAKENPIDMAQIVNREQVETDENDSLANTSQFIAAISNNPSGTSIAASWKKRL